MSFFFQRNTSWGLDSIPNPRWTHKAACSPKTAEWFWPVNKGNLTADTRAALAICARCPAKDACREYAITNGETEGVWGGLTETELRQLVAARGTQRNKPRTNQANKRVHGECVRCGKFRELTGRKVCVSCTVQLSKHGRVFDYPKVQAATC